MRFPVKPLTKQQLDAIANPQLVGQPEATAWDLYDTQNYVDNTTTRLSFFTVTNVDPSITNMENAGQLPDPKYFRWYYAYLDVLRSPTANTAAVDTLAVTGALDDIQRLIMTSRARWTFTLQDKTYGPFPLSRLHSTGGQTGFSSAYGTAAATNNSLFQFGNNNDPASTFCWDGSIVIPPKVGFSVVLDWPAVVDLTADVELRFVMSGVLFRAVR